MDLIQHLNKGREFEDIWLKEASYGKVRRKYGNKWDLVAREKTFYTWKISLHRKTCVLFLELCSLTPNANGINSK